jgi:hypothetical protein
MDVSFFCLVFAEGLQLSFCKEDLQSCFAEFYFFR